MAHDTRLSDQQYTLVSILWRLGSGSARQVHSALGDSAPAYTTVATLLTRLEKKGVLSSEMVGRERVFHPLVAEKDIRRSMLGSLVGTLFGGDPKALLAHMVREGDIDEDELDKVRTMLDRHDTAVPDGYKSGDET